MALCTVSDVEAYLGVSLDSADSAVYSSVIDAVSLWIEYYCDTKFDDAVYSQRLSIIDNHFTLKNNLQYFYGVSYGVSTAMTVVPPSALSSIVISDDGDTLSLIATFAKTDIDISAMTLSEVVTAISNEAGWTATIDSEATDGYAKTLYPGSFRADINDSNTVTLFLADDFLDVSQVGLNLFECSVECTEAVAIYQGGFATVPDDLNDTAIRFSISAYNDRNSTSATGTKKSEKVGDYAYTNFTASEESAGLEALSIDYRTVLDKYAINKGV